ncbi:hypothetical protein B4U79_17278 [Dinothrombium tinctorium]|uniref:Uncharacterized protein n=1 Tax=Dinothrombium tinctorium TaxID=1965070 RepID=A0A443RH51_9ACAR|nr:hypothetical protein B4U79_17278 [Dinothrombium tinctorium]
MKLAKFKIMKTSKVSEKKSISDAIHRSAKEEVGAKLRGLCLIINNRNFVSDESTSDVDEANLVNVFSDFLGFKVKLYRNLNKEDMLSTLKNVANDDELSACEVFTLIILAKGNEDSVFCVNNGSLLINEILTTYDCEHCPKLNNKPKICFFIGDRGTKKDPGVLEDDDCQLYIPPSPRIEIISAPMRVQRPKLLDTIVCYSTTSGYVAHENSDGSSWYGQALCKVLKDHAEQTEVINLLRFVDAEVYEMETEDGFVQSSSHHTRCDWNVPDSQKQKCFENYVGVNVIDYVVVDCDLNVDKNKVSFYIVPILFDIKRDSTKSMAKFNLLQDGHRLYSPREARYYTITNFNNLQNESAVGAIVDLTKESIVHLYKLNRKKLGRSDLEANIFKYLKCSIGNKTMIQFDKYEYFLNDFLFWSDKLYFDYLLGFGFNTEFLGCPQAICLNPNLDAVAFNASADDLIVFRAVYYWRIKLKGARVDQCERLNKLSDSDILWVDAAFYFDNKVYMIIFGSIYETSLTADTPKFIMYQEELYDVEAAFTIDKDLYIVRRDNNIHRLYRLFDFLPSFKLNTFEYFDLKGDLEFYINAAYRSNSQKVILLRGWKYTAIDEADLKQNLSINSRLNWHFSSLEVLTCFTKDYGVWGKTRGFAFFKEYVDNYIENKSIDLEKIELIAAADLLFLFVIEIVAVAVTFFYWFKYRKERERGLVAMLSTLKKEGKKGTGERFKRIAMERSERLEKSSRLDSRRSNLSQSDIFGSSEKVRSKKEKAVAKEPKKSSTSKTGSKIL